MPENNLSNKVNKETFSDSSSSPANHDKDISATSSNTKNEALPPAGKQTVSSFALFPLAAQGDFSGEFTSQHIDTLAKDPFGRFPFSSPHIAHAFIFNGENGITKAWQWDLPSSENINIHQLTSIQSIERNGETKFSGIDENNHTYFANRYTPVSLSLNDNSVVNGNIVYFSKARMDAKGNIKEPFWGNLEHVARFQDKNATVSSYTKSHKVDLDIDSLEYRENHPKRRPSQNQVMGGSAKNAVASFRTENKSQLTSEINTILENLTSGKKSKLIQKQLRPEWLHGIAHSLSPQPEIKKANGLRQTNKQTFNPQSRSNLGAASAWSNTQMIVLERLAKWFKVMLKNTLVSVEFQFEMLAASEVINKILFEINIALGKNNVKLNHTIDPLTSAPVFWDKADIPQTVAISDFILREKTADKILEVEHQKIASSTECTSTDSSSEEAKCSGKPFDNGDSSNALNHTSLFNTRNKQAANKEPIDDRETSSPGCHKAG